MSSTPNMLDHALAYLARGWPIFPVLGSDKQKRALIRWGVYQNRLPTEAEVKQWWRQWPDAGIGLATGRLAQTVVVDIDPQHGGTSKGLPATGVRAQSGGGGEHYFYAYPKDFTGYVHGQVNSELHEDPQRRGRDVRADGNYIILPPSLHWTGNRYAWIDQASEQLPPPGWALTPWQKTANETEKWLTDLFDKGPAPGTRNDQLARAAGYLASHSIALDVAQSLLRAWIHSLPELQREGFEDAEIDISTASVYRTAAKRNPTLLAKPRENAFRTYTLSEFMLEFGAQDISWDVQEFLPSATIGFIAAPPGSYKTWLMYDLAISVASGQPFLGRYQVPESGHVLVVQQEDFTGQTAERISLVLNSRLGVQHTRIASGDDALISLGQVPTDKQVKVHFHVDRHLRFADKEVMAAVELFIQRMHPKLVIIDPFYSTTSMKDFMVEAVQEMSMLKSWRDKYGCSFLLVHHTTKDTGSWDRTTLWGTNFLNAFAETLWHLRRPDISAPYSLLLRYFKVEGPQDFLQVNFDISTKALQEKYNIYVETVTPEDAEAAVAKIPKEALDPTEKKRRMSLNRRVTDALAQSAGGLTTAELMIILSTDEPKTLKSLHALQKKGEIKQTSDGGWVNIVATILPD